MADGSYWSIEQCGWVAFPAPVRRQSDSDTRRQEHVSSVPPQRPTAEPAAARG